MYPVDLLCRNFIAFASLIRTFFWLFLALLRFFYVIACFRNKLNYTKWLVLAVGGRSVRMVFVCVYNSIGVYANCMGE